MFDVIDIKVSVTFEDIGAVCADELYYLNRENVSVSF